MRKKEVLTPVRGTWDDPEYWYDLAHGLPELACERCGGYAWRKYWIMDHGRQVGYHCHPCGWEKVVWVQEGWGTTPQRPSDGREVPDTPEERNRERVREQKRRKKRAQEEEVGV